MQKETEEKLRYLITQDTWMTGHPSDLERFYQFVVVAYKNNDTSLTFDEFFGIIKETQNNGSIFEDKARNYYSKYETAIEAIKVFDTGTL